MSISTAQAGFEWIPPTQVQHASQVKAPDTIPLPMAPDMPASITPPVPSVPLGAGPAINPYPSDPSYAGSIGDMKMGTGPVEKAMMEESHNLNPAPLGNGLTTAPDTLGNRINMQPTAYARPATPPITNMVRAPASRRPILSRKISRYDQDSMMPLSSSASAAPSSSYMEELETLSDFAPASTPVSAATSSAPATAPAYTQDGRSLEAAMFEFNDIQGFGQDMPLAVALTQIVPSDYALSFETDVNPGTPVSWEGGRPWDQVLDSMLDPLGLQVDISGKVIRVRG